MWSVFDFNTIISPTYLPKVYLRKSAAKQETCLGRLKIFASVEGFAHMPGSVQKVIKSTQLE